MLGWLRTFRRSETPTLYAQKLRYPPLEVDFKAEITMVNGVILKRVITACNKRSAYFCVLNTSFEDGEYQYVPHAIVRVKLTECA